ncbi:protein DnrP [Pseudomonas nitroreducens]|uniref:protein DnrP n=1 Tax=Pseudomonas nitroreducens TaxID=46680 RepID=UPI00351CD3BA
MRQCLYCQHESPEGHADCPQCGMPLPVDQTAARQRRQRRQRRFAWYCAFLALFCLVMMLWLPR